MIGQLGRRADHGHPRLRECSIASTRTELRPERRTMKRRGLRGRMPDPLPQRLKPLFWDHHFARLTWDADADLITSRILAAGDWDSVRWLRRSLGDEALRSWLERRRGAGLSARQLRFWELVLNLSHREVKAWLADRERQVWEGRLLGSLCDWQRSAKLASRKDLAAMKIAAALPVARSPAQNKANPPRVPPFVRGNNDSP
jgi:hypothetical protein